MFDMFFGCSSLKNINFSNSNTNEDTYMSYMFYECSSLKNENIITKDKKILTKFKLISNYKIFALLSSLYLIIR